MLQGYKKRDPSQVKGRQIDDSALREITELLIGLPIRRDTLIEALHLLQDNIGCLHNAHLTALAEIYKIGQAEVFEVASFYHHFDIVKEGGEAPAPVTIRVCNSLSCKISGADELIKTLRETTDSNRVRICAVPCIGRCAQAPAACIGKRAVNNATAKKICAISLDDLAAEIPKYEGFFEYEYQGGYSILKSCLSGERSREEIIKLMSDSGIRGLGGAGFPAGRKWDIVSKFDAPRLMTINGDEGEPGTFKDRYWLEKQPHRMLEGALIAAWAVGCSRIYPYIRDEYPAVLEILKREIKILDGLGLTKHASFDLRRGAGAYICGEESAMIESIEGKRGIPRQRPPYIAESGLFNRPTLNHNIETLSWVADIIKNGPKWFADMGDGEHNGPRSFSISGRVKSPGVKIAPAGTSINRLIEDYCDGMADGHELKAFLPGGASGGIFPASMADLPMDFGTFDKFGGFIGSHAVVILSDRDNIKDVALNLLEFFEHESCGQCTPCRQGTQKMVNLLQSEKLDQQLIDELALVMSNASICGLGQAASNPVSHLLTYFQDDLIF